MAIVFWKRKETAKSFSANQEYTLQANRTGTPEVGATGVSKSKVLVKVQADIPGLKPGT
jgi:hypothetical protein